MSSPCIDKSDRITSIFNCPKEYPWTNSIGVWGSTRRQTVLTAGSWRAMSFLSREYLTGQGFESKDQDDHLDKCVGGRHG